MKLAALAAAWLAGLALAYRWYDADPVPALLLALFALVLALLCRLLRPSFPALTPWPALLLCLLLLGLWRYEVAEVTPPTLVTQDKGTVSLRGQVVSDPEATSTRIQFRLQVSEINRGRLGRGEADWAQQSGKVLVYAHPPATLVAEREHPYFRYGDRLELAGTLQRPQPLDGFDYPAYLESQGIYAIFWSQESVWLRGGESSGVVALLRAVSYDLRRKLARSLELSLPPSQAALAQALLLGLRGQLPDDVVENFRQTGTSHLLAISGLHLGILLALALGLLQRLLGRHTPFPLLLTLALIWLYVLVSGAPASVVRAAIMGSAYLAALGLGRPRDSLAPALGLSALAMTALEPGIVTQLSFQLSFAAMAGIVLALPWQEAASRAVAGSIARRYGLGHPVATPAGVALGWLAAGSIVSLAATLATFPLVSVHFQQLPLLGIPATLVATPLLPFALVGGLAAALAGLAHPLLGQGMGLLAAIPLSALLELVALVPGWTVSGQWVDARLAWAWYVALVLTLLLAGRGRRSGFLGRQLAPPGQDAHQAGWQRYAAARRAMGPLLTLAGAGLLLLAAAAYLAAGLLNGSDGKLHVYFFDVGQGDSILIVTPGGRQVLVDGGPGVDGATRALAGPLYPWDRSLDLVAATHLDTDHSRGLLRVLETYRVDMVATGPPDPESSLYPQWQKAVAQNRHQVTHLSSGQTIPLEEGITLEVLHPPSVALRGPAWDSNNNSLVLRLTYGAISFLLTGDIEAEAEGHLARAAPSLQADVLKAGHHGSNSSTTAAFLRAVQPRWAVISAGQDNQYGHPHPEVMARLEAVVGRGAVFSTAEQGTIQFSTDGQRLWLETER